jgi:hypothetical protein
LSPKERELMLRYLLWTGVLSVALCLPSLTPAAVYRCTGEDGVPGFQALPCAGQGEAPLQLPPLNALGDPIRPAERRWLQQRSQQDRATQPRRRPADTKGERRRQAERCLRQRQRLEAAQAKLRRGYKPAQGERLRRRRDEHREYLRRFCD